MKETQKSEQAPAPALPITRHEEKESLSLSEPEPKLVPTVDEHATPIWVDDLLGKLKKESLKTALATIILTALVNGLITLTVNYYLDKQKAEREYGNNIKLEKIKADTLFTAELRKTKAVDKKASYKALDAAFLGYQRQIQILRILSKKSVDEPGYDGGETLQEAVIKLAELQSKLSEVVDSIADEEISNLVTHVIDRVKLDKLYNTSGEIDSLVPSQPETERVSKKIKEKIDVID